MTSKGTPPKIKPFFLGDFSQMWMGGVADFQTRSKPLKKQITPKIPFMNPNFTFRSPKSHKKPGGGWVCKQIWERSPKKNFFWGGRLPLFENQYFDPSSLMEVICHHSMKPG